MKFVFPIYGFHITKPITHDSWIIHPRTTDHRTAETWSRDLTIYHLTGALTIEFVTDEFIFNLEAALAFIEQIDVVIGSGIRLTDEDDPFSRLEISLNRYHHRNNGGGEIIGKDTFFPLSRQMFILKLLNALNDHIFCEKTQFKQLFFKCVEQFRQRKQFIEVSYFLVFSGLETFARAVGNDRNRIAAIPITNLLKSFGFDVSIDRPADLARAISTYAHLRNAVFHNSEFSIEVRFHEKKLKLNLFEYLYNITQLTNLLVLKAIQFDDNHINWDSWVDRQPFY